MAGIDEVLTKMADLVAATIAPYQPNVPSIPNTDPRAGSIVSTYVGEGHPLQLQATVALEQGKAIVGVYDTKVEKLHSITSQGLIAGLDGNFYQETGRSYKELRVEVWAYKYEQRNPIVTIIRGNLGDDFSFEMTDGTTTKFLYQTTYNHDEQQVDSWWIGWISFRVDISSTRFWGGGDGTATIVTETELGLDVVQDITLPDTPPNQIGSYEAHNP